MRLEDDFCVSPRIKFFCITLRTVLLAYSRGRYIRLLVVTVLGECHLQLNDHL